MSCEACHGQVLQSVKTSDINLPDKASCVTCHSAKGRVVSTCATCHDYHQQEPARDMAGASVLRRVMSDSLEK
jgi:DnaJ-class molecular chaperone